MPNSNTIIWWQYILTWQNGRELASAVKGGVTTSYKYGADGLRVQKTVGNVVYNYYYSDGLLVRQTWVSNYIDFLYDESGLAYSFVYDGTQYYYVKNLQGDVVAIANSTGTIVVNYTYDAWGNILSTTGSMASIVGAINPIRYRSYYYDTETGFYYLQSRYYDPEIKRFINADSVSMIGKEWIYFMILKNQSSYRNKLKIYHMPLIIRILLVWVWFNMAQACIFLFIAQHPIAFIFAIVAIVVSWLIYIEAWGKYIYFDQNKCMLVIRESPGFGECTTEIPLETIKEIRINESNGGTPFTIDIEIIDSGGNYIESIYSWTRGGLARSLYPSSIQKTRLIPFIEQCNARLREMRGEKS